MQGAAWGELRVQEGAAGPAPWSSKLSQITRGLCPLGRRAHASWALESVQGVLDRGQADTWSAREVGAAGRGSEQPLWQCDTSHKVATALSTRPTGKPVERQTLAQLRMVPHGRENDASPSGACGQMWASSGAGSGRPRG